jgi:GntR family transcriptional regulator
MKLQIDPTLNIPLHLQVEKLLREYIEMESLREQNKFERTEHEPDMEQLEMPGQIVQSGSVQINEPSKGDIHDELQFNRNTGEGEISGKERVNDPVISTAKKDHVRMFPKEVDLANELGVARNTVRQAISKLVNEGLLIRKKGVGTIVRNKKIYTRLDNWFSFTGEMKEKGLKVVNHNLELKKVQSDIEVSEIFNISNKTSLLCLTRLRGTGERPYLLSVSWFHPRFSIDMDENFSMPLYKLLEEKYDIHVSTSREEICAVAADDKLAGQLQVKKGDPLLFRKRSVFNSDGLIVEFNKVWYRGDGISYSLEIGRQ